MTPTFRTLAGGLLLSAALPASALTIQFDYSYDTGFFSDPLRRSVLQAAGDYLGSRINDTLTAITSQGGNSFGIQFTNPADGSSVTIPDYSVAADTLVIYVGGQALGGSTLGYGGPGGWSVEGTLEFIDNAQSRGQAGVFDSPPTDFGPWGGAITFDSDANWYFDSDVTTDESFTGIDFYSVALHELGHVLGIGTSESWQGCVSGSDFVCANSVSVYGGAVPLDSIQSHWLSGTVSPGEGEAAMDPSLSPGQRKRFTALDWAGLRDVGWEVQPVPVPAAVWLFASGLGLLAGLARRRG